MRKARLLLRASAPCACLPCRVKGWHGGAIRNASAANFWYCLTGRLSASLWEVCSKGMREYQHEADGTASDGPASPHETLIPMLRLYTLVGKLCW